MLSKTELWTILSELAKEEGVELFEVVQPAGRGGIMQVFIYKGQEAIQHVDCGAVANRILNHPRVEEILPGTTTLEVSSPGINRKLTRPEHFLGAIGERAKVSFTLPEGGKTTVTGTLKSCDDVQIEVSVEPRKKGDSAESIMIPRTAILQAKIDFIF